MIKAIQTQYKGHNFRSRLEARWAVFFDALGIEWGYEAQGYDLGELGYYLPDFWLPEFDCWIEVKPDSLVSSGKGQKFAQALAGQAQKSAWVVGGLSPDSVRLCACGRYSHKGDAHLIHCGGNDFGWFVVECRKCKSIRVENPFSYGCTCPKNEHAGWHSPQVQAAYTAARSARFEHGQSGATTI